MCVVRNTGTEKLCSDHAPVGYDRYFIEAWGAKAMLLLIPISLPEGQSVPDGRHVFNNSGVESGDLGVCVFEASFNISLFSHERSKEELKVDANGQNGLRERRETPNVQLP